MTPEERAGRWAIKWCRESGERNPEAAYDSEISKDVASEIEAAVAEEREACAKEMEIGAVVTSFSQWRDALTAGAAAIRARA